MFDAIRMRRIGNAVFGRVNRANNGRLKPCDGPKQRGFADAIGTTQDQRLASTNAEGHALKHGNSAARDAQVFDRELHAPLGLCHRQQGGRNAPTLGDKHIECAAGRGGIHRFRTEARLFQTVA